MDCKTLRDKLQQAGIAGAGGAGFPTYAKLDERADTILLNCAECEPLLSLHRQLLALHTEEILSAFEQVACTVGAERAIVCVKKEYKAAIQAVEHGLESGLYPHVSLHLLQGVYPMGDEVVLVYEATGRVIRPGGLPIEEGVIVFNVETMYNVSRALTQEAPVTKKLVTMIGELKEPKTLFLPLGTSLEEAIALAGGPLIQDYAILVGGPMMGREGRKTDPVTRTTNAVLVLPSDHGLIQRMRAKISVDLQRAASICCQCRACTDLCPRNALGHPIEPHKFMRSAANRDFSDPQVFLDTFFCSSCGTCELYACPQSLSPRTLITAYKNGLRKAGVKAPADPQFAPVSQAREYRKVPEARLKARLGLSTYDRPAPLCPESCQPKKVRVFLSQHIGAPALAVVEEGALVKEGQTIGRAAGGLSLPVHASIGGRVSHITEKWIEIIAD